MGCGLVVMSWEVVELDRLFGGVLSRLRRFERNTGNDNQVSLGSHRKWTEGPSHGWTGCIVPALGGAVPAVVVERFDELW